MSRKKVKSAGKNPPDFTAGIKVFFRNAASQIFRQKILDKIIIITTDGKFALKKERITAARFEPMQGQDA